MLWNKSAVKTENRCYSGHCKYKRAHQCPI